MHREEKIKKNTFMITFGNAVFKDLPIKDKQIIKKSKEIQSSLKYYYWDMSKLLTD